jgi:NitT/TauT family transport system substrate-binding protein
VALEKPDIVIGAPSGISSAALFIAQDDGLFRKAGLHVKIEALGASGPALPELLRGQLDVLEYPWTAIIEAGAAGTARLHAIAGAQSLGPRADEILVLPRSGITTVAQLRGKTIGVPSPGGLDAMLVDSVLADYAVGPAQVHLVPVGAQDMESALATHRVDAIEPGEPLVTLIEEELGAVGLVDVDQGAALGFPLAGYAVTDRFLARYPRTTAALSKALDEANAIASADLGAVQRAVTQSAHVSPAVAAVAALGAFPTNVDPVQLQRVADLMLRYHELSQPFNVTRLTA